MQIPILNGIYTNGASDFRVRYPWNLMPIPVQQGISNGYLRPGEGIVQAGGEAPGLDRGGINWNGVHYRVMGTSLVSIDDEGSYTIIDTAPDGSGGNETVTFDYSFDYLSLSAGGNLYLYDGVTVQQITDPDLGLSIDHIWVDGYFMSTDGTFIVVTELNDPFTVLPTKYAASEIDPDPVKAILKYRDEPYVLNRHTIEVFSNIGGVGFPFQRIDGAQIERGTVGVHTCCLFLDGIAFMGSGRNEAIAVWMTTGGTSVKISTREVEEVLATYTEDQLEISVVESRLFNGHFLLYVHLPDQCYVYDGTASIVVGQPVWFTLGSGVDRSEYRAKNFVWCYDKWWAGDPQQPRIGYMTDTLATHWGENVGWIFNTAILYNEGRGAIFHELELVSLTGRAAVGDDPTIWTQYSLDGLSWSVPKSKRAGTTGERNKRLVWLGQGNMHNWRLQRFYGTSDSMLSMARLEARIEPLSN